MVEKLDYVIELPGLRYDKVLLSELAGDDTLPWVQWASPSGVTAKHKTCLVRDMPSHRQRLFVDMMGMFDGSIGITIDDISVVNFPPSYSLPPHVDPVRSAAVIIPLDPPNPNPIYWEENGTRVFEQVYRMPTIINVQRMHGVMTGDANRLNIHIDIMRPWEFLVALHEGSTLLV